MNFADTTSINTNLLLTAYLGAKMLKTNKIIICLSLTYLSACSIDGTSSSFYDYEPSRTENSQMIYPDSYDSNNPQNQAAYDYAPLKTTETVEVPDSYHVGLGHPTSAKDLDKSWVKNQNPNAYTIELAKDSKPAAVAGVLQQAPKNERSAEIKTNNGSYTGVYGTYSSYEAAKEKLDSLPDNVKQNASIKSWQSIQGESE